MKRTLYICLAAGVLLFLVVKLVPAPNQPTSARLAAVRSLASALALIEHQSGVVITNWDQAKRQIDLGTFTRRAAEDRFYDFEHYFIFACEFTQGHPSNGQTNDSLVLFQSYPENRFSWNPKRFAVVRTGNSFDVRLLSDTEISRLLQSDSWKAGPGFRPVTVALAVFLISGVLVLLFRACVRRKKSK